MPSKCFALLNPNDRPVASPISLVCWNPTVDLLAIATVSGDVLVQRLFWKKAWQVSNVSTCEADITALCWTDTGAALIVGDSYGSVRFLLVENGHLVHHLNVAQNVPITWLCWHCADFQNSLPQTEDIVGPLPSLEPTAKESEKIVKWTESVANESVERHHSILISVDEKYVITLWANGILPFQQFSISSYIPNSKTLQIQLNQKLDKCFVAAKNDAGQLKLWTFNLNKLFSSYPTKLWLLSQRRAKISETLEYMDIICQRFKDAWEDLLVEIDDKFSKFAKEKFMSDGGSVGNDLIVLLVLGTASPELEEFLLHSLTEKGIKRVSQFLNTTYQKLLDLVSHHFHFAVTALTFHLSQLKHECGSFGELWKTAVRLSGSLALKVAELRSVITHSRLQLRTFFRCLHKALLQLSNEQIPGELSRSLTDEDTEFVVQFIQDTFMKVWSDDIEGPVFRLEKVGQYLQNGPLVMPLELGDNPWSKIEKELLADSDSLVFDHQVEKSLTDLVTQVRNYVENAEMEMLRQLSASIELAGDGITISENVSKFQICTLTEDKRLAYFVSETQPAANLISGSISEDGKIDNKSIMKWHENLQLIDFDFYKNKTVFGLMQDKQDRFWLSRLDFEKNVKDENYSLNESNHGQMKHGPLDLVFVSGERRVGCVLSKCKTRVRLLDLEPDESSSTLMSTSNISVDNVFNSMDELKFKLKT